MRLPGPEARVDLQSRAVVAEPQGDLVLHAGAVRAAGGVRPAGDAEWREAVPLALGARLQARDASGRVYEVVVESLQQEAVWLSVARVAGAPARQGPHPGTFRLTHWSINGSPAEPRVPALVLKAGGEYDFGGARGRWCSDGGGVSLSGAYAGWGRAELKRDGEELHFDYTRGPMRFEVVMTRDHDPGAQASR